MKITRQLSSACPPLVGRWSRHGRQWRVLARFRRCGGAGLEGPESRLLAGFCGFYNHLRRYSERCRSGRSGRSRKLRQDSSQSPFSTAFPKRPCCLLVVRLFTAYSRHQAIRPFCFLFPAAGRCAGPFGKGTSCRSTLRRGPFLLVCPGLRSLSRLSHLSSGAVVVSRRTTTRHQRARPATQTGLLL